MTAQSTQARPSAAADAAASATDQAADRTPQHGAELFVPLNLLKASPRNARKVKHSPASLEALAASIKAKGVLQPPVVEIERGEDGGATGKYLVTIGEGRRLALRMLVKRKVLKRNHPVRVTVDTENDAHEISLDENVTREAMHPADQFEAFKRLSDERGYGAEEIGARFGVTATVVRQRLRLGAAAPTLMAAYRDGTLTLDQLMAFCVSPDQDRQRQVFEQLGDYRPVHAIRRAMTETKVRADDPRARFVGVEVYEAEGGAVLRDLFTEDGAGWLEDPALLDRLAADKLSDLAQDVLKREGWKWAEAGSDYQDAVGLGRVYPAEVIRPEADAAEIAALSEEYDRLISATDSAEALPPEVDARLEEIDKALQAFGPDFDYPTEVKARAGVMVLPGHDGLARFERGLVRPEDVVEARRPDPEVPGGVGADDPAETGASPTSQPEADEGLSPLSDRLVIDLTAHRTMGLRDAVQADATLALTAVVHALVLQVFYPPWGTWTPLQLRLSVTGLERLAPGVGDSPAGRRVAERLQAWGARLPQEAADLWPALEAMAPSELLDLLACCAGASLYAVRDPHDRKPEALAHAETLATATGLDMTVTWTATAASYFSRVSKARMLQAVTEATTAEDAARIAGLKKGDMAEAAERLVEGRGWLPPVLRTRPAPDAAPATVVAEGEGASPPPEDDAYAFAAE
ncbi:chromosome partitioning protein ParB [Brevundimonas sp. S30B]|uniref:ParB/RepB/Spo0J family partition protein n=1 Tax=unclassified Brevundimonas TaxID=2622653 RepID=UPI001071A001|nr:MULTISPECIES: ParB/RepB/Spo0J family partition protein [unclassified Brevundimonas]QBX38441.1 chromosome partitioning protein ParB [Brevundimonas sp. MF30-B]TFW02150.1 chromosome partitioning protein ParB [Brevundimonas sp. S30B]